MTFLDGFLPALGVIAACGFAYMVWRFWKLALIILAAAIACVWGWVSIYNASYHRYAVEFSAGAATDCSGATIGPASMACVDAKVLEDQTRALEREHRPPLDFNNLPSIARDHN
ncbi:hypothetical protein [Rhizobium mayense]|uniref:Uncharacterized protein n=1 Tax=Rhizobium mayense TaxID=1312184 RepID=A0ABT7JRB6_9HYPH|nr:hypothetical protein [Rhizobium mayense]MDL2398432.1 hypothetical protein [Rhizobium mayense]